jgi:CubicO group peptidase (beta-lactamase class C family)
LVNAIWNSGDTEIVRGLVEAGLDVNSRTPGGLTPWLAARLKGQTELADFLAGKDADCNAKMPPAEKVLDAMFENVIKPDGPGASVLVARDGKILFEKGYGLADIEHHVPVTPETRFRIGSITKQFTAAAILKLQEQGKLSVEDTLSKYFPDYPRGGEVKLRHLLTHTSGIHSYTSKPGFMDSVTKPITSEALINSFKNDPFDFDPGKKWSYCNSGFFLLGCIVEKVSGDSYEDFLRKNFFEPLGMRNTGVHHSDAMEHAALGYDGSPKRAVNWDMTWAGGAGALYSMVGDLFRWNEAVFHGNVLSEASLKAAFKPVKTADTNEENAKAGYGYGWAISEFRGAREISHGGGLNGFTSHLLRLPGKNFTAVVLMNGAPNASPQTLAQSATEVCLGLELQPRPKAIKVPQRALELLAGRYDYGQSIMTVSREGEHLFAQLTFQPRFEIFPKSETEFFWKVADAQVQFVKGEDGKIVEAVHHQNGAVIHARRLGELKIAEVDPSVYDALVGSYKSERSDLVGTITREGNRLFGQVAGQPKLELLPVAETEFTLREVNAQVIFLKDASGKVTKVRIVQDGETNEASKINP